MRRKYDASNESRLSGTHSQSALYRARPVIRAFTIMAVLSLIAAAFFRPPVAERFAENAFVLLVFISAMLAVRLLLRKGNDASTDT